MTFAAFIAATALWSDEGEGAFMLPGKITHQLLAGITEIGGGRGDKLNFLAAQKVQT